MPFVGVLTVKNDINEAFRDLSRIVFEQKDKINEIIDIVNNLKKEDK